MHILEQLFYPFRVISRKRWWNIFFMVWIVIGWFLFLGDPVIAHLLNKNSWIYFLIHTFASGIIGLCMGTVFADRFLKIITQY